MVNMMNMNTEIKNAFGIDNTAVVIPFDVKRKITHEILHGALYLASTLMDTDEGHVKPIRKEDFNKHIKTTTASKWIEENLFIKSRASEYASKRLGYAYYLNKEVLEALKTIQDQKIVQLVKEVQPMQSVQKVEVEVEVEVKVKETIKEGINKLSELKILAEKRKALEERCATIQEQLRMVEILKAELASTEDNLLLIMEEQDELKAAIIAEVQAL